MGKISDEFLKYPVEFSILTLYSSLRHAVNITLPYTWLRIILSSQELKEYSNLNIHEYSNTQSLVKKLSLFQSVQLLQQSMELINVQLISFCFSRGMDIPWHYRKENPLTWFLNAEVVMNWFGGQYHQRHPSMKKLEFVYKKNLIDVKCFCQIFFGGLYKRFRPNLNALTESIQQRILNDSGMKTPLKENNLAIWTHTICNLDKYNLQSGQIQFAIWTNTKTAWKPADYLAGQCRAASLYERYCDLDKYIW